MTVVEQFRLLADFFESHPELDPPSCPDLNYVWSKEQMLLAAKVKDAVKEYDETYLYVIVPLGEKVKIKFFTDRYKVCEPLETEDVLIPAQEARISKKVIKWKCHPLLEPTEEQLL